MGNIRLDGDVQVTGALFPATFYAPDESIGADAIATGDPVPTTKLDHRHRAIYSQETGTVTYAETRAVHVVEGATGTVLGVTASPVVAATGDSTVTVDVKIKGDSVLASTITVDSGDAAYAAVAGSMSGSASLVAGDVVLVFITVSAGTGTLPEGVIVSVDIDEKAA